MEDDWFKPRMINILAQISWSDASRSLRDKDMERRDGMGKWDSEIQGFGKGCRGDIAPRVFDQDGDQRNGTFHDRSEGRMQKKGWRTNCASVWSHAGGSKLCFSSHILLKLNILGETFSLFTLTVVASTGKCLLGPRHPSNPLRHLYDMVLS